MKRDSLYDSLRAHVDHMIGLAIVLCVAALYIRTAGPTLGGGYDSAEFQHAAFSLGIAHETGYPAYLLLGKLFTTLVPIGDVAHRMNLLSALLGACAALFVYLTSFRLAGRRIAALFGTALFVTNVSVWRQSGVASVAPLHFLLTGALVLAAIEWQEGKLRAEWVAFFFGLNLAHHRSVLVLAPLIALMGLRGTDRAAIERTLREQSLQSLFRIAVMLVLPLLLYLYLPIFGGSSPWYDNSLRGMLAHINGSTTADYVRTTQSDLTQAALDLFTFQYESFGMVGAVLIVLGLASVLPRWNHWTTSLARAPALLLLGLATVIQAGFAIVVIGEADRYLSLPFFFLVFWFSIGAGHVEHLIETRIDAGWARRGAFASLVIGLVALVALPFEGRFRQADWSAFDREYKQWDEIFSLPIPRGATVVGNWSQLNAMRYMQRVEQRRLDLQPVGTQYDPEPQTEAAKAAFAEGRAIFLAPSVPLPTGSYRYGLLGPLLQVKDQAAPTQIESAVSPPTLMLSPALALERFEVTTALEPYAPTSSISPNRTARVALHWRAGAPLPDMAVRLRLYDPEARLIVQKEEPPVRGLYPSSQWLTGERVDDVHNILILPGTPPGAFKLTVQVLAAGTGQPTSDEIVLTSIQVEPSVSITRDQVFVRQAAVVPLNDQLELWGHGGLDDPHRAGDVLGISLVWHVRQDVQQDLMVKLALLDAAGRVVLEEERAPLGFYPTRQWRSGQVLKAYYDLQLPTTMPPGELTVAIGLVPSKLISLGTTRIVP